MCRLARSTRPRSVMMQWLSTRTALAWQVTVGVAVVLAWVGCADTWPLAVTVMTSIRWVPRRHGSQQPNSAPVDVLRFRTAARWFGGLDGVWTRTKDLHAVQAMSRFIGPSRGSAVPSDTMNWMFAVALVPIAAALASVAIAAIVGVLQLISQLITILGVIVLVRSD